MTLSQAIPTAPAALRPFLQFVQRRSANDNSHCDPVPALFATYTDPYQNKRRVRCVTASRLGRVGITECLADENTPQRYVTAASLSQFLDTAYPMKATAAPRIGRARVGSNSKIIAAARVARLRRTIHIDSAGFAERVAVGLGVDPADILGDDRSHLSINVRRAMIGMLATRRPDYSLSMLGSFINVHHTTAHHTLMAVGLRGDAVDEFDLPFLRAAWVRLGMTIGYGPGEMPAEVAERLGRFMTVHDGIVEPSTWVEVRKWLARRIGAERREKALCAA